jgi:hypothetical protein
MGVGLRNLRVRPAVHVVTDEVVDRVNQVRCASLMIDGLLCGL